MRDLVSIMNDENVMLSLGFNMMAEDGPKEKNEIYTSKGISEYTRIASRMDLKYSRKKK